MRCMNMSSLRALLLYIFGILIGFSYAFPEQGKWELEFTDVKIVDGVILPKSLFKGSQIIINLGCTPIKGGENFALRIAWSLTQLKCWNEYLRYGGEDSQKLQNEENLTILSHPQTAKCDPHIILEEYKTKSDVKPGPAEAVKSKLPVEEPPKSDSSDVDALKSDSSGSKQDVKQRATREEKKAEDKKAEQKAVAASDTNHPKKVKGSDVNRVYTITADGIYLLNLNILSEPKSTFNMTVEVQMLGPHGFLSAVDWPLLPFYGGMCLVYVVLGLAWLIVSFCQWRDLLRIQFWIGGVILLGMLEKATFYAEYQSINSTGQSVRGAVLLAELVSCGKRMLARMLVIIVSLGFGIVKPRLGPMLHRVVFTGVLYFILASVESYLRVMHQKNDPSNQILVASIPLAVLDSAICWWIFTSLVQTTRTLRLRRNMVKLSLYRHFTNTLIFSVVSSVVFMLYSIKFHRLAKCLTDWKELWVDDAYWHLLFSVLLLVIMILWRPTNNNQRYAFTPLLDAPEDDEEEEEQFINDAFGVKMRGYRSNSPKPKSTNSVEEDLKWVEDNIPSSMADTALPILDSDEEIMTTKFEVSKMQ